MTHARLKSADPGLATSQRVDSGGQIRINLLAKEYYVTACPVTLTTTLGSCVVACLRDPAIGWGGMNHFMLPDWPDDDSPQAQAMIYGGYAMNRLIEALTARGARRQRLEAKVFGAGNVLADMRLARIGDRNARFVKKYLAAEKIAVVAEDLGGEWPRQVEYAPATGRARVRRLRVVESSLAIHERHAAEAVTTDVALIGAR